jgi:hypothetical protein
MSNLIRVALVITAVIHLLPLSGVLGATQLARLYGLDFADPNLAILMRHRAVLFGVLGAFLLYAAFRPELRVLALLAGSISVVSFLALALSTGDYNAAIHRVVIADWIATAALLFGWVAWWLEEISLELAL